jgi:hypothetical protein
MSYLRKSSLTSEEVMHNKRLKEIESALEKRVEEKNRLDAEAHADWLEANSPFVSYIKIGKGNWEPVNYLGDYDCYA